MPGVEHGGDDLAEAVVPGVREIVLEHHVGLDVGTRGTSTVGSSRSK